MPVLVGFCVAIQADAASAGRAREASLFLEALQRDAPDRAKREAAIERFVRWAAVWLARERVRDPVLFPLPAPPGASGPSALASALARHIGPAASVRPILERTSKGDWPARVDGLIQTGTVGRGAPILFGEIYDADILRASALKLNDAGAKPMHALYTARIGAPAGSDPFDVRNESFSVR